MTCRAVTAFVLLLSPVLLTSCSGSEARQARYLERGEQFIADQNYDKARVEISNALQINPNNVRARLAAARIAEKQQKPADAVANYQAVIDIDKENVEARAALGRIFLIAGLTDRARDAITPAIAKAPQDSRLLVVRGGLKAVEGDIAGALQDAQAAVKAAPDNELAVALLAAQFRRQEHTDDAIAALKAGIERKPDSVDLRLILAELQEHAGHKELAEEQLKIVADRNRTNLAYWQQLARFHLLDKNGVAAEQALRDAVKYNPESIPAKSALVGLIANLKGLEAAQAQMLEFLKVDPKRTELKMALGQFYEASRKPADAEATYREIIAVEGVKPFGLEARNRLAAVLVQKPDLAATDNLIKEVLAQSPRDNDALILRSGLALARGDTASAITDLRAVLRDQPNSQPLMRALARAHVQDRDMALAEEVLRNAVQLNPADQQSRFDLAALLALTHREKQALPMLEGLAKEAPENIAVREALFRVQLATGDVVAARATADETQRLRPDLEQGYLLSGTLFESQRELGKAREQYEAALQKSRTPVQVLAMLVRVDLSDKQPKKALDRLTAYLQKYPQEPLALELMGEVRLTMNDSAEAIASFDRAIASNPKWWLPYRGKALAQDAAKQPQAAIGSLQEGFTKTGALELGMDLALRQDRAGDLDAAIKTYEQMLARAPKSLAVANNLAMMLVDRRKDVASFERADQLAGLLANSEDASFLDTRGWIKFRRGDLRAALPLLQQAAAKSPKSPEIQYHLGMVQLRNGDKDAAKLSLESAVSAKSAFAGLEEARATLAAL